VGVAKRIELTTPDLAHPPCYQFWPLLWLKCWFYLYNLYHKDNRTCPGWLNHNFIVSFLKNHLMYSRNVHDCFMSTKFLLQLPNTCLFVHGIFDFCVLIASTSIVSHVVDRIHPQGLSSGKLCEAVMEMFCCNMFPLSRDTFFYERGVARCTRLTWSVYKVTLYKFRAALTNKLFGLQLPNNNTWYNEQFVKV